MFLKQLQQNHREEEVWKYQTIYKGSQPNKFLFFTLFPGSNLRNIFGKNKIQTIKTTSNNQDYYYET